MPNTFPEATPERHASPTSPSLARQDLPAVLRSFPSPASVTDLSPPLLLSPSDAESAFSPGAMLHPALPSPSPYPPTTPFSIEAAAQPEMPFDLQTDEMNLIVGGALAPVVDPTHVVHATIPPKPKGSKTTLRLPSFESLGIASPHPDRMARPNLPDVSRLGLSDLSASLDSNETTTGGTLDNGHVPGCNKVPVHHFVTTITPPNECGEPAWTTTAVASAPIDSPETEPAVGQPTEAKVPPPQGAPPLPVQPSTTVGSSAESSFSHGWVDSTIQRLLLDRENAAKGAGSLRVLSHALPSPSTTGHVYTDFIHAVHDSAPDSPTTWINVFHALPGRFNLSDMPLTSPPSTPGPAVNGDDYFTQKILFDTAVSVTDYQKDLSSLPRSPRPVVPPGSVDVAIVERYIPPSSHHEFANMFNPSGPSVLVDRLVELSPHNGNLVFIYPTRRGGEAFLESYLNPILRPTMLFTTTLNGVSPEMGRAVSSMPVARLPDYDEMVGKMTALCQKLSEGSSQARGLSSTAEFTVVHSETQNVRLPRRAWSEDWWTKQEKPRIREVVSQYMALAKPTSMKLPHATSPGDMISKIFDQVINRPYSEGDEPRTGIEVSIFIVKRSS